MLEAAVVNAPDNVQENEIWIEALPARIYHTPQYGPVPVSYDKLERFVKNFNSGVRGQEIATDFDHGMDRAKGNQASGWYRELKIGPSTEDPTQKSLFARVELTDDAKAELAAKKWKYFSLEWDDEWMDNDGRIYNDVVTGGAFTNRPIAKKMMPINFSEAMWNELDYETKKEFAVWSTAFVNDLPDSAFLYIQPGGNKDSEGKTKPRSLRHFPYKGPDGKIDLPHLRNAIARIPQAGTWLSESLKSSLQSKARNMLSAASKAMSEGSTVLDAYELLVTEGYTVVDESKELEHSEPGTGSPPAPRRDGDGSDDLAVREGWRVESPPDQNAPTPAPSGTPPDNSSSDSVEGGNSTVTPEEELELKKILNVEGNANLVDAARIQLGELTELRRSIDAATQERQFAEAYPAFWQQHNQLMDRDRDNSARQFSESVQRIRKAEGFGLKETPKGLSSMSLTKVKDLHKKFAEGTATLEEFEDCIRTIVNGGIVEFGELGSSATEDMPLIDTSSAPGIAGARKLFGEVLSKIQGEHPDWSFGQCLDEAARKHPDLADAYSVALPG